MLQLFPWLAWIAPVTSAVVLIALGTRGELGRRTSVGLSCWFLVAVYCQFVSDIGSLWAVGLLLQTALAISLLLRLRLDD